MTLTRRMGRWVVLFTLVGATLALMSGTASALPGDPPVESVSPADGAVLPINTNGIPVVYTCPVYKVSSAGEGFSVFGGRQDYNVAFASSPALGGDGRLLQTNWITLAGPDAVQDNDLPQGQCRGFFATSKNPQSVPGTYYWQPYRICTGCATGYEVGPVRSFRLTVQGSGLALTLRAPARVYAGYRAIATVSAQGATGGTPVVVEGLRQGVWRSVGQGTVLANVAEVPILVGSGVTRLRAAIAVGGERIEGSPRAVTVARAVTWPSGRQWVGPWRGTSQVSGQDSKNASFKVASGGKILRQGQFIVTMLCPTPGLVSPFTIQIATAFVPSARIAPDGTFVFAGTAGSQPVLASGRLVGRTATAKVRLSIGNCSGTATVRARRV